MLKLINSLCGKINFIVDNKIAILEVSHISTFDYCDKIYSFNRDRSDDLELCWTNDHSSFYISASLSDNFRQVYLKGTYYDGFVKVPITMTDNYILERNTYISIRKCFSDILINRLHDNIEKTDKKKAMVKTGMSLAIGTAAYITAGLTVGLIGLLILPLAMAEHKKIDEIKMIERLMERNPNKTIKQLHDSINE